MKTHIAIFLCDDGQAPGCRKMVIPNSTPKRAMKAIIRSELLRTIGDEDPAEIDHCLNNTIEGSFQKVGGGIYTCADEDGTYVVTAL
jgi:hypothetical protein